MSRFVSANAALVVLVADEQGDARLGAQADGRSTVRTMRTRRVIKLGF